jgi:glutamate synthase (NADPH/NADH) small chain
MPEICGRICPQDRLCEGNCVIEQSGHGTVTIGAVEKYINDTAWEQGWVKPLVARRQRRESIGIIGAGPAGLAAAEELRRKGYRVTVYDRHDRAGGLLVYGIPNFKLEKDVVARRVKRLADGGIEFKLNFEVGRDATLEELRARHDAVFIATGVYKAREIEAPGVGLGAIVPALDYLIASNRKGLGDAVPEFDSGKLDANSKDVAVIGGGDTAMDCVRTAMRQGARSVSCLYRRDRDNMPGSLREVANAEEEGVDFKWLTLPRGFLGKTDIEGVRIARMRLGLPDVTGRKSPEEIKGADFTLKSDLAIKALGFDPEDLPRTFAAPNLSVTKWGTLRVRPSTLMTNIDGVFAGGDIVRGASLVVWAIRDGSHPHLYPNQSPCAAGGGVSHDRRPPQSRSRNRPLHCQCTKAGRRARLFARSRARCLRRRPGRRHRRQAAPRSRDARHRGAESGLASRCRRCRR